MGFVWTGWGRSLLVRRWFRHVGNEIRSCRARHGDYRHDLLASIHSENSQIFAFHQLIRCSILLSGQEQKDLQSRCAPPPGFPHFLFGEWANGEFLPTGVLVVFRWRIHRELLENFDSKFDFVGQCDGLPPLFRRILPKTSDAILQRS